MKFGKRAVAGESVLTIYRLVLITIIALIILGMSAVYYDYYINVRDAEAGVMGREVVNCLAPEGVVDLGLIEGKEKNILNYCGYEDSELEIFYVLVVVENEKEEQLKKLEQGDSGFGWIKEIFENKDAVSKIKKYKIGTFDGDYNVFVLKDGEKIKGKIKVEVLVNHDF